MKTLATLLLLATAIPAQVWSGGQGCDGVRLTPQGQPHCIRNSQNNMVFWINAPNHPNHCAFHIEGAPLQPLPIHLNPLCWLHVDPIVYIPVVLDARGRNGVARAWSCLFIGVEFWSQAVLLVPGGLRSSGWVRYRILPAP